MFLTITTLIVILYFGLWPRSSFMKNNVAWLADIQALDFRSTGMAYLDDLKVFVNLEEVTEFTLQLRVAAQNIKKSGFRPILMIHGGSDAEQLVIWQWGASIIAMNGDDYSYRQKLPRVSAHDVFRAGESVSLSLCSTKISTLLSINGELTAQNNAWQITLPKSGEKLHLILGNSVYAKHGWQGLVYSLSMHTRALSPEETGEHYDTSFQNSPQLHLFQEQSVQGTIVMENFHIPLLVPERLVILKRNVLTTPWHHFNLSRNFFIDILINFAGFIPFGALLFSTLRGFSFCTAGTIKVAVVASCFLLSLIIEIGQIWQLTRYSSSLDVLMNTGGGYAGVLLLSLKEKKYLHPQKQ